MFVNVVIHLLFFCCVNLIPCTDINFSHSNVFSEPVLVQIVRITHVEISFVLIELLKVLKVRIANAGFLWTIILLHLQKPCEIIRHGRRRINMYRIPKWKRLIVDHNILSNGYWTNFSILDLLYSWTSFESSGSPASAFAVLCYGYFFLVSRLIILHFLF